MKLVRGLSLLSEKELKGKIESRYQEGVKAGQSKNKTQVENLEKAVERKTKDAEKLKTFQKDLELKIEELEAHQDAVREIVKKDIQNKDMAAILEAKKDGLDTREAKLKDRAARLAEEEAGEYKKGYADGVADGVRKISEITQGDRDNAMKIAMVAASSHTPVANMKEAMDVNHQLTEGSNTTK